MLGGETGNRARIAIQLILGIQVVNKRLWANVQIFPISLEVVQERGESQLEMK